MNDRKKIRNKRDVDVDGRTVTTLIWYEIRLNKG